MSIFHKNWKRDTAVLMAILVIIVLVMIFLVYLIFLVNIRKEPDIEDLSSITTIQGNTLVPISAVAYPKIRTLGVLMEKIIQCESGGDPKAKNPKSTAYGLCQFLDGTWKYVQEKWDIKLDRDNLEDQLYACERLLREEGLIHWKPVWECINYYEK